MLKRILPLFLLAFLCASTAFAERTILMPETTFTAPFVAENLVTPELENMGAPFKEGIFVINYIALSPDGAIQPADYRIFAVLEAKGSDEKWYPIAMDTLGIRASSSWPIRILILNDKIREKVDLQLGDTNPQLTRITYTHGRLPEVSRIRFHIKPGSVGRDLTSFTVSVIVVTTMQ